MTATADQLAETYGRRLNGRQMAVFVAGGGFGSGRATWADVEEASDPDTRRRLVDEGIVEQHPEFSGCCRLTGTGRWEYRQICDWLEDA